MPEENSDINDRAGVADTDTDTDNTDNAAAASSVMKRQYRRSRAIAFGRNYYHALGGTTRWQQQGGEGTTGTPAYTWDDPPWCHLDSSDDDSDKNEVRQVDCTAQSTVFLTQSGKIYQTGTLHGRVCQVPSPVIIPLPLKCVEVSAGRHFCLGRMEGGLAVVSWGAGHFGQLGVGTGSSSSSGDAPGSQGSPDNNSQITFTPHPVIIERLLPHMIGSPTKQVAAGDWHALALTESGRVWAWGSNRCHQCGRKPSIKSSSSQAPTLTAPLPVPLDVEAVQISAGRSHSVALARGGHAVYCWGASNHGQCGNVIRRSGVVPPKKVEGLTDLSVSQISAGGNHTIALTSGGRVFVWGSGTEGELGLGVSVSSQVKPRLVGDLDFVAIAAGQEWKSQQKLQGASSIETEELTSSSAHSSLSKVPKISKVYAGASYSAAVSSSGHVYTWGSNDAGQTGVPTPTTLPFIDNLGGPTPSKTSTIRDLHVQTFDSRHNLLLPVRVELARSVFVRDLGLGPNHMWCIGEERTEEQRNMVVGRTLYEVQEDQRMLKLHRARDSLLSKVHGAQVDASTEGTTTHTDNTEGHEETSSCHEFSESAVLDQHSESSSYMPALPVAPKPPVPVLQSAFGDTVVRQHSVATAGNPSTAEPLSPATSSYCTSPVTPVAQGGVGDSTTPTEGNSRARQRNLLRAFSPSSPRNRRRISIQSIPRMLRRFSLGTRPPASEGSSRADAIQTPAIAEAEGEGDVEQQQTSPAIGSHKRRAKRYSM